MISIIVPTCNEEETIKDFLIVLKRVRLGNFELIIVDDSSDRTTEIAKKLIKKFKIKGTVVERIYKSGKGSAIRDGLKLARGESIVLIDADLQYNPRDIPRLLKKLKTCDLVNTRKLRKDPFHRKLEGLLFRLLVYLLFGLKLETQSTLRAFRKELKGIEFETDGFCWDVEFLYKVKKLGYKICEIPVIYSERRSGKSKINLFTTFKMLFELLQLRKAIKP